MGKKCGWINLVFFLFNVSFLLFSSMNFSDHLFCFEILINDVRIKYWYLSSFKCPN